LVNNEYLNDLLGLYQAYFIIIGIPPPSYATIFEEERKKERKKEIYQRIATGIDENYKQFNKLCREFKI
jgi:hypothetical protein